MLHLGRLGTAGLHGGLQPGADSGQCSIVVLYEDILARQAAIELCDSLAQTFYRDLDFQFSWWRFKYLNDQKISSEAVEAARNADLLLVSVQSSEAFPLELKAWFERWLSIRETSEGALVFISHQEEASGRRGPQASYLYLLAQRAKFDFLPLAIGAGNRPAEPAQEDQMPPDFLGRNSARNQRFPASGWGLNE